LGAATTVGAPNLGKWCNGQAEVYLDSDMRRGSDVLKALALGARAVGVDGGCMQTSMRSGIAIKRLPAPECRR
jgi:isopentenyl diphosphate isomerase/L-lactate dehydrogenase-like FMN-dependent dehydrogenase